MIKKVLDRLNSNDPVARATFWFLICSILQKCISLLTTPIFTRLLSTNEYGQFSVYTSWYQVFLIFVTLKLDSGVFNKGMSKFPSERNEYVASMQATTSMLCLLFGVILIALNDYFVRLTELPFNVLVLMLFELMFAPAIGFWTIRERYEFRYKAVIFVTLIIALMNCIVGLSFVLLSNDKGLARILSVVAVQGGVGLVIYAYNYFRCKGFGRLSHIKFAFCFNIPLIPHYLSMYILNSSDKIMIQKICGTSSVALYGVVHNIALLLQFVIDSINSSLAPWLYQKMETKDRGNIEKTVLSVGMGIMALLALFILVAPEALLLLAGSKYIGAINVLPCITSCVLCIFLYQLIGNIEFYYDSNKFTMLVSSVGALLNIALNLYAIPRWGYAAAGWTTLICNIVFVVMHSLYAKHLSTKYDNITIISPLKVIAMCLVMVIYSVLMSCVYEYTILRYSLVIIVLIIGVIARDKIKIKVPVTIKKE